MRTGEQFIPYRTFVGSFIPNSLMRYTGISAGAKLVWARLAQFAGERGIAYPSQSQLAQECGITERWCRQILRELEEQGFIRQQGTYHRNKCWIFLWHDCLEIEGKKVPVSGDEPSTSDQPNRKKVPVSGDGVTSGFACEPIPEESSGSNRKKVPVQPEESSGPLHEENHEENHLRESHDLLRGTGDTKPELTPGTVLGEKQKLGMGILRLFEELIFPGRVSDLDMEDLNDLVADHGQQAVLEALEDARRQRKLRRQTLPYVRHCFTRKRSDDYAISRDEDNWR